MTLVTIIWLANSDAVVVDESNVSIARAIDTYLQASQAAGQIRAGLVITARPKNDAHGASGPPAPH